MSAPVSSVIPVAERARVLPTSYPLPSVRRAERSNLEEVPTGTRDVPVPQAPGRYNLILNQPVRRVSLDGLLQVALQEELLRFSTLSYPNHTSWRPVNKGADTSFFGNS